ncbi:MAG TPA: A/G-specific adenine glycosylase [Candidatus Omnitrophota bacterium]|nr:A/G-specific adenine glycosylase [Candidatus Omnitrophota bacterium]HRZ14403.1 A/G-specific adenine glycosylase [Candidatus Omnitrophota bacterium]
MPKKNLSPTQIARFRKTVYAYYRKHRRDLPWRRTSDPYKILVSEIMLQQTQVDRVQGKYREFVKAFPTVQRLAKAPLRRVLAVWQGMGYNRRALALQRIAQEIIAQHRGKVPRDIRSLDALPGIGPATASSISAFAFNFPALFIETNIRSVFIHHFFNDCSCVRDDEILPLLEQALDRKNAHHWYSALMDYGVSLKKRFANPSRKSAHYSAQGEFAGSDRQLRGRVIKLLVAQSRMTESSLIRKLDSAKPRAQRILKTLRKEGILKKQSAWYTL